MPTGISARDYIRWVQRSLNRLLGAGIIVDGVTTAGYYEWVNEFKWSRGLPSNSSVDEATQNKLIKANHTDPIYVIWVQQALIRAAAGPDLKVNGTFGPSTKTSLQSFQSYNGLLDDGWMGARTETKLIEVSGLYPPGEKRGDTPKPVPVPPKPPAPDWIDPKSAEQRFEFWCGAYRSKLDKMDNIDQKQKKTLMCILEKLRLNRGWFDYMEARDARMYVNSDKYNDKYPSELAVDARMVLKLMTNRVRAKAKSQKEGFQLWQTGFMRWYYDDLEKGLSEISNLYSIHGYEKKAKMMMQWRDRMEKDSRSIIWCYYEHQKSWW